ncbi:MAG: N-glycosylase/DNA lyase [Thermofilaceae archaeon]|nr:N-glycosylase/DNA lyase [Thermofilaceae archaeon]
MDDVGAFRINKEVLEEISLRLMDEGSRELIEMSEEIDPQMNSVKNILAKFSSLEAASFYIIGVASISYQLSAKGEEHWAIASSYASGDPIEDLQHFTVRSPTLRFSREAREARVKRLVSFWPSFKQNFTEYISDLERLRRNLAQVLRAEVDAKTVVFSVKMFYYALKASDIKVEVPFTIPIPVDRRVCLVSLASRLVEGAPPTLEEARKLLSKAPKLVAKAWNDVSLRAMIPPLRLDALLWLLGGCYERGGNPEKALEKARKIFPSINHQALSLVKLLIGLES